MTSLSESEIFRILENANSEDYPPDEVRQILNGDEIKEKLTKVSTFYERRPTPVSAEALKKAIPKGTGSEKELDLVKAISATLQLEHLLAYTLHKDALLHDEENEQRLNHSDDFYSSLDPIICARDFYLKQRHYLWKIVQEVIRISLDTSHAYHLVAVEYIAMLCERNFIGNLITSLGSLYAWQPFQIDEKSFPDMEAKAFRDFCLRNDDKWAESVLGESELALDTLILILYESTSLSIENFKDLLNIGISCKFNVPHIPFRHLEVRGGFTSTTHLTGQNNSKRFHLKWIVFSISVYQFYLCHSSEPDDAPVHPFFQEPIEPSNLDIVDSISKSFSKITDPIGEAMKMLWFLFLDMLNPISHQRAMWSRFLETSKALISIETLTILCNDVLPLPNYAKGIDNILDFSGGPDEILDQGCEFQNYFFILQDCVNALVTKYCNAQLGFGFIDLLSQLIDMTYRGDALLCKNFWDSWTAQSNKFSYPLCQLLRELAQETWLEPLYMIRIVNSITCFTEASVEEIILLFMKPVPLITEVRATQLHICRKDNQQFVDWEDWYQYLDTVRLKHQTEKAKKMFWNSLRVSLQSVPSFQRLDDDSMAYLASPRVGDKGIVRTVFPFPNDITCDNYRSVSMKVQWFSSGEWFSTLISILHNATTNVSFDKYDRNSLFRVVSALTLFGSLISQISMQTLSELWEEVCLKSFFRKYVTSDADVCYALLRKKMAEDEEDGELIEDLSVIDYMKGHQQELYKYFINNGVDEEVAYIVASEFQTVHTPNFVELVINTSVNMMTSLMRCKVTSPNNANGLENRHLSIDHAVWQTMLQKSMYLLQCVANTSTTPSIALHILSKITKSYNLSGPNSWTSTLFRISSIGEGITGRYLVTNEMCKLLHTFFLKLQTPVPPDARNLHKLFCELDYDGSGGIDREELRKGLSNYGYAISASAVNVMFQKIDEDNSGTVEFSELLQYTNRTTLEDVENGHEDTNSELFKAEKMLVILLRDLTCPGGGAGVEMAEALSCSTVEFCISCLSHLDKWKHTTNLASRWILTLTCLTVLAEILSRSSPLQCESLKSNVSRVCWDFFLKKFVTEKSFQTALMQLCLLQGLTALQASYTSTYREVPRSFKAVLRSTSQSMRDFTAHDVLPVNFSRGYYEIADSYEKQLVEQVSLKALKLYSLIVDSYVYCTNSLPAIPRNLTSVVVPQSSLVIIDCFEQLMAHFFSSASSLTTLPVASSQDSIFAAAAGAASRLAEFPCSFFAVMFSFVDFPKKVSRIPRPRSDLPEAILEFISKLLSAMKAHNAYNVKLPVVNSDWRSDPYSFLTGVGISNMTSICVSLCTSLKFERHLNKSIIRFIINLCTYEPLSLVQLFNVPNPSATDENRISGSKPKGLIEPQDSYLVQTIEELLKTVATVSGIGDDANFSCPDLFHLLLLLVLSLLEQIEHKSIGNIMLYLCRKKSFWDCITVPLMVNVPELEPNPNKECNDDVVVWRICETDTVLHSLRLMCHSTALRVLARARFGLLFFTDEWDEASNKRIYESAEAAESLLDKFFDEKSRQNRFLSWVEFYTRVDVDSRMHDVARDIGGRVGVHLDSFMTYHFASQFHPYYARIAASRFGRRYLYDVSVIENMQKIATDLCVEDMEYKRRFQSKNSSENWKLLVDTAEKLNLMWTVADAQTDLLKSWKEFIETYIKIPPNRPVNYVSTHFKKHRHDVIDRSESIGTPSGGDASPSSKRKSCFKFDRRSYELASEIIRQVAGIVKGKDQLNEHGGKAYGGKTSEGVIAHHFGADVAVEKCDLLVSMLHYQLRDVTHRDTDPSSSLIAPRENLRFDKNKVELLLGSLEVAFERLTEGLYVRPPAHTQVQDYAASVKYWKQYKDKIMLRLLTAKLMLFQALSQHQQNQTGQGVHVRSEQRREDCGLSIDSSVCLQTFGNIRVALTAVSHDSTSFSDDGTSHDMKGIPLSEKIILICLRLFNYISPKRSDLSFENTISWRDTMHSSNVGAMLVGIFRNVCTKNVRLVEEQHDYSTWTERWNGRLSGGAFEIDIKGVSDVSRIKKTKTSNSSSFDAASEANWATLNSILDTFLAEGLCEGSVLFSALLDSDLLVEVCQAPILLELQRKLCRGPSLLAGHRIAAYMGYNATTGNPSALMGAWCKVVQIFQCALRASCDAFNTQIKAFITTFNSMLLLPLPSRPSQPSSISQQRHFYTIQQMRLTNAVLLFFRDCLKFFSTWKVLQVNEFKMLIEKSLGVVASASLVVGDVDKSECNQKVMNQVMLVISAEEHDEASEKAPEMSRMRERGTTFDSPPSKDGSLWNTPPRGGSSESPGTGSSVGGSYHGRSASGSCSKATRAREKQHNLSNFFVDTVWAIFGVLNPCLAVLRIVIDFGEICGEEYEIDYSNGGLRLPKDICDLPVGSQTYYMSQSSAQSQLFTQGVVIKVNYERKSYDIQSSNGLVDVDVPCNAVAFFAKPLIPHCALSTLNKELVAESRLTSSSRSGVVSSSTSVKPTALLCSTAHLMKLLTCTLKWSKKWNNIEVSEHEKSLSMKIYVDLSILCGQLVWLIVVNVAHHSCCASDEVYTGIGEQLDEVRDLIKKDNSEADERADAFLNDPDDSWESTRSWFEKMYQRIMYLPGKNEWGLTVEKTDRIESARPSFQLSQGVSVSISSKPAGNGTLRGGATFV